MGIGLVNLSKPATKEALIRRIRQLSGVFRFEVVKYRPRRSDKANAYYWAVVVPSIAQAISDCWGETLDADSTHEFLKTHLLGRPVIDRTTGETKGLYVPRSSKMNSEEFAQFVEKAVAFAAQDLGIVIMEPNESRAEPTCLHGPLSLQPSEASVV